MSSILTAVTHALELFFVFLVTYVVAASVMGLFGGAGLTEMRLALVESIAAVVVWARYGQRPA